MCLNLLKNRRSFFIEVEQQVLLSSNLPISEMFLLFLITFFCSQLIVFFPYQSTPLNTKTDLVGRLAISDIRGKTFKCILAFTDPNFFQIY
jgi:hypothetical protein